MQAQDPRPAFEARSSASVEDEKTIVQLEDDEARLPSLENTVVGTDGKEDSEAPAPPPASATNLLAALGNKRKWTLMLCFVNVPLTGRTNLQCMAMFIDIAGVSASFLMTAPISADLGISIGDSAWVMGTYGLTFAATLLFAGRLADLFPPSIVYALGFSGVGVFSLIISFMTSQYAFYVLRALSALFAVLTIPSSINMIIQMYPEPREQAKKLALFGMAGPIANTAGLILAGGFVAASWRWYFRFVAIISIPISIAAYLLLPRTEAVMKTTKRDKLRRMDLIGVVIVTAMLILFILAFTQATSNGWDSAIFIAPVVIAAVLLPVFIVWEYRLPDKYALLPHDIWQFPNIFPLILQASACFLWFATYQLRLATYWQEVHHDSAILTAVKLLPMGITGLIAGGLTQPMPWLVVRPRYVQPVASMMCFAGSMLLAYSDGGRGDDYWKYVFTGEIIGTVGGMFAYIGTNTCIIMSFPLEYAGVGGSFSNMVYQIFGAVGIAIQTSLLSTAHAWDGAGPASYDWVGDRNGYIFTSAYILFTGLVFVVWYRQDKMPRRDAEAA